MTRCCKIVLLFFLVSCTNGDKPVHIPEKFDKQGHRGCRGIMPENTIPAMIKAVDLGVTTLEMDIAFSADKKAILSHEPFFNHDITTKADGSFIPEKVERSYNIYRMSYDEIKGFDVGMKPNPRYPKQMKLKAYKPLLSDVIDSVENHIREKNLKPVYYNIETKTNPETDSIFHPDPAEFVDLLMTVIDAKKLRNRVIIQSFDIRPLQYLHQHYPDVKTSLLIEQLELNSPGNKITQLGFQPDILSPEYRMVTKNLVDDLHAKKIKVIPWTVNDTKAIENLLSLGVDGIITDYPNLLK
jgi:glycerophosphoryl diester phosphodiesterase